MIRRPRGPPEAMAGFRPRMCDALLIRSPSPDRPASGNGTRSLNMSGASGMRTIHRDMPARCSALEHALMRIASGRYRCDRKEARARSSAPRRPKRAQAGTRGGLGGNDGPSLRAEKRRGGRASDPVARTGRTTGNGPGRLPRRTTQTERGVQAGRAPLSRGHW